MGGDRPLDSHGMVAYPAQSRLRTTIWGNHMTYAIVETGGKQYRVTPGDLLDVDRFDGEKGTAVEWTNILLYRKEDGPVVGNPVVPNVKVMGTVVHQGRRRSITVFKKKRRKNYIRTKGHRQHFTRVRIDEIAEN